jgi:acyl carrier protein
MQVFEQILNRKSVQVGVTPVDWMTFKRSWTSGSENPFFSELGQKAYSETENERSTPSGAGLLGQLKKASASNRYALLLSHIHDQAKNILGFDSSMAIDEKRPLKEIGFDSLMSVQLRNALSSSLEAKLPATLIFDYPHVEALANYLIGEVLSGELIDQEDRQSVPPGDPSKSGEDQEKIVAELEQLSDDEAEAALLEELADLESKKGS